MFKEDITKHACGALVNAANSKLLHAGGVAEHISTAAGPNFQGMCSAAASALPGGVVQVGNCLVTDAGRLPCTKVIHAVGPHFAGQTLYPLVHWYCCCSFAAPRHLVADKAKAMASAAT